MSRSVYGQVIVASTIAFLVGCGGSSHPQPLEREKEQKQSNTRTKQPNVSMLSDLSDDGELKTAFNADADAVRVVLILSPG